MLPLGVDGRLIRFGSLVHLGLLHELGALLDLGLLHLTGALVLSGWLLVSGTIGCWWSYAVGCAVCDWLFSYRLARWPPMGFFACVAR